MISEPARERKSRKALDLLVESAICLLHFRRAGIPALQSKEVEESQTAGFFQTHTSSEYFTQQGGLRVWPQRLRKRKTLQQRKAFSRSRIESLSLIRMRWSGRREVYMF